MAILGGGAVSYERGTPVAVFVRIWLRSAKKNTQQGSAIKDAPLKTRKGHIIQHVYSYKSHVTWDFQAFGHSLTVYWETVRVNNTHLIIQHVKYAPFSPRVVRPTICEQRCWNTQGSTHKSLRGRTNRGRIQFVLD